MPDGAGSITWRPKKELFEVRLSLGRGSDGKRVRPTRYAASEAEAKAALAKLVREYGVELAPAFGPPPTVREYLESWLTRKSVELAPKSRRNYRTGVDNLSGTIGGIRLDKLTPDRIAAALAAIERRVVDEQRERDRAAAATAAARASTHAARPRKNAATPIARESREYTGARTAQAAYDTLRAALNFAVKRDRIISRSPLEAVPRARVEREIDFLSRDEALAFLRAVERDRYRALWHLFVALGLRWSEASGLRWRDVALDDGYVTVSRAMSEKRVAGRTKTAGSRRRIDLPPSLVLELRAHRERMLADGFAREPADLVFVNAVGKVPHASNIERRNFFPALARAGVRRVRVHDLRHTCATIRLLAGEHVKVVSELLGHASVRTTMDLYAHVLPTMGRDAALRYDQTMFG
jgi:integrase